MRLKKPKKSQLLNRPLSAHEDNAIKLVQYFNQLGDAKALFGSLTMSSDAVDVLTRMMIATPINVEVDYKQNMAKVRFLLPELYKYAKFACDMAGLTLNIDGSLTTKDNLIVDFVEEVR